MGIAGREVCAPVHVQRPGRQKISFVNNSLHFFSGLYRELARLLQYRLQEIKLFKENGNVSIQGSI